jgi:hypothetical protein
VKSYEPDATLYTARSPSMRRNVAPPEVECALPPPVGSRTSAVVFGGTTTFSRNVPFLRVHSEATMPYGVW